MSRRVSFLVACILVQISNGFTVVNIKNSNNINTVKCRLSSAAVNLPLCATPKNDDLTITDNNNQDLPLKCRRSFLNKSVLGGIFAATNALLGTNIQNALAETPAPAPGDDSEDFASIAARAKQMSKAVVEERKADEIAKLADPRTAYDFTLPIAGQTKKFGDIVAAASTGNKMPQSIDSDTSEEEGRPKAILVVNIKQDDPIARKNIPEFISLATKYGSKGDFVVIACPTDQGYYEPDTSALIRLKLASEYGYGINPATVIVDKVNLLGTGAHPFWRWLEGNCRTPLGLGKIQANFEKFLLDGKTGLPLRRYPRKYNPFDMKDDIEALLAGKELPPPAANWKEEWRSAAVAAQTDTYRFQKGLNVFDQ